MNKYLILLNKLIFYLLSKRRKKELKLIKMLLFIRDFIEMLELKDLIYLVDKNKE